MSSEEDLNKNHFHSAKRFQEIPLKNPFLRDKYYWDKENEVFDKIKVTAMSE
jgi:hypothetical protein